MPIAVGGWAALGALCCASILVSTWVCSRALRKASVRQALAEVIWALVPCLMVAAAAAPAAVEAMHEAQSAPTALVCKKHSASACGVASKRCVPG